MNERAQELVRGLSFWKGHVDPTPLLGGITNVNFVVEDAGDKYVVRVGGDLPLHHVMRFNELAASRAAFAAGVSPEVVHAEPGALVLRFVDGRTYGAEDVRADGALARIVPLIKRVHHDIPKHLEGAALVFWVFQVLRDYRRTLKAGNSRMVPKLSGLKSLTK